MLKSGKHFPRFNVYSELISPNIHCFLWEKSTKESVHGSYNSDSQQVLETLFNTVNANELTFNRDDILGKGNFSIV